MFRKTLAKRNNNNLRKPGRQDKEIIEFRSSWIPESPFLSIVRDYDRIISDD
jgi:hypothetical protein